MDNAEPSTNGVSACNLFRLSSLLGDEGYEKEARRTMGAFEAEIMQYPWLFSSFMPAVVAGELGVKSVVRVGAAASAKKQEGAASHGIPVEAQKAMQADAAVVAADAAKAEPETAIEAEEKVEQSTSTEQQKPVLPKAKARGALETAAYIDESHGLWLKERNPIIAEMKPKADGSGRIMICEGKACREADVTEV